MTETVVFAIATQPSVGAAEARALGDLLSRRGTVAAATAARKIKVEAAGLPGADTTGQGIGLTRSEMLALQALLANYVPVESPEAIAALERALAQTISGARD
ncbi:MAG: hypothetical protein ACRD6W_17965 [Nitrososphaerales archaeon]